MKVLVTGGSGYIGRATIEALIAGGHGVEALARNENSAARVREAGAAPVVGALSDLEVLRSAASRSDAVIHLAQADSGEADLAAATAMLDGVGAALQQDHQELRLGHLPDSDGSGRECQHDQGQPA